MNAIATTPSARISVTSSRSSVPLRATRSRHWRRNGERPRRPSKPSSAVPLADRDVCHNMRGQSIDAHVAPTHRLFDDAQVRQPKITTIGIGDGGNELGMGQFAWEILMKAIGGDSAGRIISRVATDFSLIAGVSDWAAYALALSTVRLCERQEFGSDWTAAQQRVLIEQLVERTNLVDGLTLRREPTVERPFARHRGRTFLPAAVGRHGNSSAFSSQPSTNLSRCNRPNCGMMISGGGMPPAFGN